MRLSFALPALVGALVLGTATIAAADAAAPPAAPIFYCPSAQKAAPGAPAQACRAAAPAQHAAAPEHRHWRRRAEMRIAVRQTAPRREDVSASQAFIYRYERAEHGLDARAADQAWGNGGPPPCPDQRGCPPHRAWAQAPAAPQVIVEHAPPQPQQVIVERAPPPPPQVIIEREAPPPPKIIIEHAPAPPPQIVFERAPAPPPQVIYERAPACPDRCPPATYGWHDRSAGAGYSIERSESEQSSGWRYSQENGQPPRFQAWVNGHRARPCPPPVPANRCSGGADASGGYAEDQGSNYGVYGRVYPSSGRDAAGYLVWPGKTAPY